MNITDIVKKGFNLLHAHIKIFYLLFAVNFIMSIMTAPLTPTVTGGQIAAAASGLTLLGIIFLFVSIFIQSGVFGSARDIVKTNTFDIKKFVTYGKSYYLRILAIGAIVVSLFIVGLLAAGIVIGLTAAVNIVIVSAFGGLLGALIAVLVLYAAFLMFLAPYIVVTEDAGAREAIKKSISIIGAGVHPVVGALCLLFAPITALLYLIPSFRAGKIGGSVLVKLIALTVFLILIGFGIGLLIGIFMGLLTLLIKGFFGRMLVALFNSALNSYLGVLMTISYFIYYLSLSAGPAPSATSEPSAPSAPLAE